MSTARIYCFSDLHLEYQYSSPDLLGSKLGDILPHNIPDNIFSIALLCGDIGYPGTEVYKFFLRKCAELFTEVYVIAGNHEYYDYQFSSPNLSFSSTSSSSNSIRPRKTQIRRRKTMSATEKQMEMDCRETNCIYLQDKVKDSKFRNQEGQRIYRFIGTTLWHPISNQKVVFDAYKHRDYTYIPQFTARHCQRLNLKSSEFIQNALIASENQGKISIILTHHPAHIDLCKIAPIQEGPLSIFDKRKMYLGNSVNSAPMNLSTSYTSSEFLENFENVPYWFSGHTHYSVWIEDQVKVSSTLFLSNPLGKSYEVSGFIPERYVEIS